MVSGGEWKKSVHIKCMAIFILQLAIIYIVAKWLNVFGVPVALFLVGFFGVLGISMSACAPHKICIGVTIWLCAFHILMNFDGFLTSARREYNELKSFSGILFHPSFCNRRGSSCSGRIFLKSPEADSRDLKSSEQYFDFYCDRFLVWSCNEELKKYFGKYPVYLEGKVVISVKYAEFRHYEELLPFITTRGRHIYEISHNGKIIYPYEYFIDKYSTGKKNFYIFTIFLLGITIGFGVVYKRIK